MMSKIENRHKNKNPEVIVYLKYFFPSWGINIGNLKNFITENSEKISKINNISIKVVFPKSSKILIRVLSYKIIIVNKYCRLTPHYNIIITIII